MLTEDFLHKAEDQGVLVLAVRHDADTSSTDTDGKYSALLVDANGRLKVSAVNSDGSPIGDSGASTGENIIVANAAANTVLLAANTARQGATIFNDAVSATLKVALGFAASANAFTVLIQPQGYYEVPFGFKGAINGFASAAAGNARITELS